MMPKQAKAPKTPQPRKEVPYAFVLEELAPLEPYTKPMFGALAIYAGEQILFILRKKDPPNPDNGIWMATFAEHHDSLRKELPSMRSIEVFGPGPTNWQNIPEEDLRFEEDAFRAVALALKGDPRIGKVPARKRPKQKAAKAADKPRKKSRKK
jgi:hypothetical protein